MINWEHLVIGFVHSIYSAQLEGIQFVYRKQKESSIHVFQKKTTSKPRGLLVIILF